MVETESGHVAHLGLTLFKSIVSHPVHKIYQGLTWIPHGVTCVDNKVWP